MYVLRRPADIQKQITKVNEMMKEMDRLTKTETK